MTTYYHGGIPNLEIGSFLLPPIETGHLSAADREDRVYVTTNLLQAINCAILDEDGMVYLVRPIGRLGSHIGSLMMPLKTCPTI